MTETYHVSCHAWNEAERLKPVIVEGQGFLARTGDQGRGSDLDKRLHPMGSKSLAAQSWRSASLHAPQKWGMARCRGIRGGPRAAYSIMGDSDDSYDFSPALDGLSRSCARARIWSMGRFGLWQGGSQKARNANLAPLSGNRPRSNRQ